MKEKNPRRTKWLTLRLSEEEEETLTKLYRKTTSQSLSEYARDVLLKHPVYILFRNQSADDFLNEMIQLKRELNAIGNNFNQAVHRLHTLDHDYQLKAWAVQNEFHKKVFFEKTNEILEKLDQIYNLWLQK